MKKNRFKGGFCSKAGSVKNCYPESWPLQLGRALKGCYSGSNKTVSGTHPFQKEEEMLKQVQHDNKIMGFTLIELLVVVLIIGILAAVAVSQYQFAVDKSRISAYFPLIQSIIKAKQIYYLQNGTYTGNFALLDIDASKMCKSLEGVSELVSCNPGNIGIDNKWAGGQLTALRYCLPGVNCYSATKADKVIIRMSFDIQGKVASCDMDTNVRGQRLCKWLLSM